jgi:hypothetical protein
MPGPLGSDLYFGADVAITGESGAQRNFRPSAGHCPVPIYTFLATTANSLDF